MKIKKMIRIAMLISISIIFQFVEASIPIPFIVPGFKLGLANVVGIVTLYLYGPKEMITVNFMRILLASLLRGTFGGTSFWLPLSGMALSLIAGILFYRMKKFSIYGVSMISSVFHSVGQVIMIIILYQQFFIVVLLPILMILAIPTGMVVAYVGKEVLNRLGIPKKTWQGIL